MATKIRLQRGGRKGYAVFRVVVADSRTPRDGRFIERLGYYNPNTSPSTVVIDFDRALYWVETGAQPTDTVRNLLKHEGVYLMKHLRGGVKKGAFDEAAAQQKFDAWKQAKLSGDKAIADKAAKAKSAAAAKALEEEKKINEAIAKKVANKKAEAAVAQAEAAVAQAEAAAAEAAPEAVAEPAPEAVAEPVVEKVEAPVEEKVEAAPETVAEPEPEAVVETKVEPVAEPEPEAVVETKVEPVAE
ncbi:MAG: 30S ribosomal protein S16, partial [Prevotella sp.]|nr:30S ribosomal protein S16 [Prevotella sp.]